MVTNLAFVRPSYDIIMRCMNTWTACQWMYVFVGTACHGGQILTLVCEDALATVVLNEVHGATHHQR